MKIKFLFAAMLALICINIAFATAQAPDRIIYNGKEYALHTNPMQEYFELNPAKKPNSDVTSTGLWRGYIATFEIANNALYLKDIEALVQKETADKSFETEMRSFIDNLVPAGEKMKIDWFTGTLTIPYGKLVNYVHGGYASTYENYILLEIEKGELKKAMEFDLDGYKKYLEQQKNDGGKDNL